jgi:hypothetical protein
MAQTDRETGLDSGWLLQDLGVLGYYDQLFLVPVCPLAADADAADDDPEGRKPCFGHRATIYRVENSSCFTTPPDIINRPIWRKSWLTKKLFEPRKH